LAVSIIVPLYLSERVGGVVISGRPALLFPTAAVDHPMTFS